MGGGGHIVEDNRFDGNLYAGLEVHGDGPVAPRNRILDTGGSTISSEAIGIYSVGSVDVLDNTVSGMTNGNATVSGPTKIPAEASAATECA